MKSSYTNCRALIECLVSNKMNINPLAECEERCSLLLKQYQCTSIWLKLRDSKVHSMVSEQLAWIALFCSRGLNNARTCVQCYFVPWHYSEYHSQKATRKQRATKKKKRTALNTQELHWNNSLNSEVLILHLAQQEILCFKSSLWCTAAKYALSQFPLRAMKLQANLLLAALQRSISFAVSYSAIMCLLGPEIHSPPGRG